MLIMCWRKWRLLERPGCFLLGAPAQRDLDMLAQALHLLRTNDQQALLCLSKAALPNWDSCQLASASLQEGRCWSGFKIFTVSFSLLNFCHRSSLLVLQPDKSFDQHSRCVGISPLGQAATSKASFNSSKCIATAKNSLVRKDRGVHRPTKSKKPQDLPRDYTDQEIQGVLNWKWQNPVSPTQLRQL